MYQSASGFPYPSGRWTAVDGEQIPYPHPRKRFHTPQGVGPLSTVKVPATWAKVNNVSIPLRALDRCRPNIKKLRRLDTWFPYPSGRWTAVDRIMEPDGTTTKGVSIPLRALDRCRQQYKAEFGEITTFNHPLTAHHDFT